MFKTLHVYPRVCSLVWVGMSLCSDLHRCADVSVFHWVLVPRYEMRSLQRFAVLYPWRCEEPPNPVVNDHRLSSKILPGRSSHLRFGDGSTVEFLHHLIFLKFFLLVTTQLWCVGLPFLRARQPVVLHREFRELTCSLLAQMFSWANASHCWRSLWMKRLVPAV